MCFYAPVLKYKYLLTCCSKKKYTNSFVFETNLNYFTNLDNHE